MAPSLEVSINRNMFMLFSFLNSNYKGETRPLIQFKDESVVVPAGFNSPRFQTRFIAYMLTLDPQLRKFQCPNDPVTSDMAQVGGQIHPYMAAFNSNLKFLEFYEHNLQLYLQIVEEARNNLSELRLYDLISSAWQPDYTFNISILPIPLASNQGFGHMLGDTSYVVIGYPFDNDQIPFSLTAQQYLWMYAIHEGSHPHARKKIVPIYDRIVALMPGEAERRLGSFEEHFNVAVEAVMIHPNVFPIEITEKYLQERRLGLPYLDDFIGGVKRYLALKTGNLTDAAESILLDINAKH